MSSHEWFKELKLGNKAAFEQLVKETQEMVCRVIYTHVQDNSATEDIIQETYLRAYMSLNGLREPLKVRAWLAGIARNTAMEWIRKRRPQTLLREDTVMPLEDLLERQLLAKKAIDNLDSYERRIVYLRYQQGMSYKKIASVLDMTVSGVGEKLCRVRKKIKEEIEREEAL